MPDFSPENDDFGEKGENDFFSEIEAQILFVSISLISRRNI